MAVVTSGYAPEATAAPTPQPGIRYCTSWNYPEDRVVFDGEIWDILFRQDKSTGWTKEDRERLSHAACAAGIAIDYTGTGFPHPLGYALTLTRGTPHGFACALFEGAYLSYNRISEAGRAREDKLAEAIGADVNDMIERIPAKPGFTYSIGPEEREKLIDRVSGAGNYANSPYVISRGEMSDIFARLFG